MGSRQAASEGLPSGQLVYLVVDLVFLVGGLLFTLGGLPQASPVARAAMFGLLGFAMWGRRWLVTAVVAVAASYASMWIWVFTSGVSEAEDFGAFLRQVDSRGLVVGIGVAVFSLGVALVLARKPGSGS